MVVQYDGANEDNQGNGQGAGPIGHQTPEENIYFTRSNLSLGLFK